MHAYLEVLGDIWRRRKVDATIGDADELVHHRLVGPLREQRSNWVVASIEDQKQWRDRGRAEVEELGLRGEGVLRRHSDMRAQRGRTVR